MPGNATYQGSSVARRPARAEGVGQLRDGENPLTAVPVTFVLRDSSQKAEVVCLNCLPLATVSKFALDTMPDQYGVWLHLAGEKGRNLPGNFSHLAFQGGGLHSKSDEGVAVGDISEIHITA